MKINKIRIEEEHPMTLGANSYPLPVCDLHLDSLAGQNGYLVKASSGLEPTQITQVVEGFDSNGVPIYGPVAEKRSMSFKVGLTPGRNRSFGELRDDLYKYMARSVVVSFMNGSMVVARTRGHIRNVDASHFTSQPEVVVMVECEHGELVAPEAVHIPFSVIDSPQPLIAYPEGTAPAGLDLQFEVTTNHSNFSIFNHAQVWHASEGAVDTLFKVTYAFLDGDVITISTHPRERRITLLRGATTYDIAGYLNAGAVWPRLYSGVNVFSWDIEVDWVNWLSASYTPRYWGV